MSAYITVVMSQFMYFWNYPCLVVGNSGISILDMQKITKVDVHKYRYGDMRNCCDVVLLICLSVSIYNCSHHGIQNYGFVGNSKSLGVEITSCLFPDVSKARMP